MPGRTVGSNTDQAAGFVGYQSSATGNAQQNGESTAASERQSSGVDQQSGGEGQVQDAATPASSTPQTASAATGSGQATTASSGSKGNQVIDTGPPPVDSADHELSNVIWWWHDNIKRRQETRQCRQVHVDITTFERVVNLVRNDIDNDQTLNVPPTTTTTKPKTTTTTTTTKSTSTTGGATK